MCVRGLLVLTSSLGSVRVLSFVEYRFFFFFFFFFLFYFFIKLMRCESPKVSLGFFFFFFFFFFLQFSGHLEMGVLLPFI